MGFTLGRPRQREEWRSEAPANQMAWIGVVGAERAGANRRGEVVAESHIVLRDSLDRRLDGLANPLACPFSLVRLWVLAIAGTGRGEFRGVDLHAGIRSEERRVGKECRSR